MEERDLDFLQDMEQLLDEHDYALPEVGDIRTGVIVSRTPQGIIVDLGLKRDGIIQASDLEKLPPEERDALETNEEIQVYIVSTDQPDSLIVSRHMAMLNQDWIRAQEFLESGEIFEGEIVGYNRGGALVQFGGLRGFVPASHLTMLSSHMNERQRQQKLSKVRGEVVPLKVIEVDRRRRRLVLSQRDAEKVWQEARRKELLGSLEAGDVISGRVSGWRDFGAFVDLGGVDGLVHVSELAWYRVDHPREVVKMGEELDVYVLKVDRQKERISLSRKKLLANPWSLVDTKYREGQLVEGKIIRIVDYGAFVELEPGIEGLLHVSQLSRSNVQDPREVVQESETHLLRIISIDADRERIGLSLKAVRAQEQIEWMTRKELEAQQAEEERLAAEARAEEPADEAEPEASVEAETEPVAIEAPVDEAAPEPEMAASSAATTETPEVEQAEESEPAAEETAPAEEAAEEAAEEVEAEAAAPEEGSEERTSGEEPADAHSTEASVEAESEAEASNGGTEESQDDDESESA